jgi:hypothetical protein
MLREVVITKNDLARHHGLGKKEAEIAQIYGVLPSEIREAKAAFGIGRSKSKKEYTIKLVNDVDVEVPQMQASEEIVEA